MEASMRPNGQVDHAGRTAAHRRSWLVMKFGPFALLLAGCLGVDSAAETGARAPSPRPMELQADELDAQVPSPEIVLGHALGDGAVHHDAAWQYARVLADTSRRVTVTPYAVSHEGRTLFYMTVTSPENHARLAD